MPLQPFKPVGTARTTVRPVQRADLDDLLQVNGDDEVTKFLPYTRWRGAEDAISWFDRMQAVAAAGTGVQLVIELNGLQRVVGSVLLFKFDAASARAELGYVLCRAHWRQGLAAEALRAVCSQAFGTMGLRRIEAEVHPDNGPSNALLRKLGFVQEGHLRQRWVAKGAAYDTLLYGCLAQDWQRTAPAPTAPFSVPPG